MEGEESLGQETSYGANQEDGHLRDGEASRQGYCGSDILDEMKKQLRLAGPLIAVSILQNSVQLISVMFNGHLGELPLSSASLATSFASVTGFSVLNFKLLRTSSENLFLKLGMASALETLCGQAYGAKQYHLLGIHMQRAVLTLLSLSIPLSVIWFYTSTILISLHQNYEISIGAGIFNRWMIPSLFAFGLLQCLNRFLQTQNIVFPTMISSAVTALLHTIVCWLLVYKFGLGIKGAALANNISYWLNVFSLAIYVKFSGACRHTWTGFSRDSLHDFFSFVRLAIPSAVMICFEYWSFEMVVLLSGLLKNPKLETSVLSISVNTMWMVYMISVGLGGAISTRVSNELGAGKPQRARLALLVAVVVALLEGACVGIVTILVRHVWGKLFSNEKEVINYVAKIMPLLVLSDFLDGFQCVLSGAARGGGWQKLCAFINLGAYYVVAIPSAVLFAFFFHIGGMVKTQWQGLWTGIICGLSVQVIALITVIACINWEKEAMKAVRTVREAGRAIGIETDALLSEESKAYYRYSTMT
ncbi:Multi antimicrobial extrusion protein [Parasponia andersonii]|uniref:Protein DETOXIFICATION n=1 Tax=Parasponia andersonii TaxID=3476 RepID=A0A2P5DK99_PARAD|nr:Multi antimicrobial extrusion protein [Parasponia andersonii]